MALNVETVVIPAAGLGTRVSGLTTNTCKEMLPYNGLPLIEHAIIESAKAGFKRIIVVSSLNKKVLNQFLTSYPKVEVIYQTGAKGLGHAILQAKQLIKDDYFAILLPDVIPAKDVFPELLAICSQYRSPGLAVTPMPKEMVSYSGIIAPVRLKPNCGRITALVEKPDIDQAPSNLGIIGRYIVDQGIFGRLEKDTGPEVQLTPSLRIDSMYYQYDGKIWDGGSPNSYSAS